MLDCWYDFSCGGTENSTDNSSIGGILGFKIGAIWA